MRCILFFLLFIFHETALSQNKQLLFNFDELPQNLMTNPGAEVNFDLHAGLPLFSQIHFSAGSSGVSLYDIFKEDGNSVNDHIAEALADMNNKDFFSVHQQLEILSIGWRGKNDKYFSGGIYQEMDAFAYFPKDLAVLAYEGNKDHLSETFDFSEAAFTGEFLNVFHFGMTRYYSENLNYGFRVKLYSSVFNARSTNNRGTFRTIPSPAAPNMYRHFLSGIDVLINTSGWAPLVDSENVGGRQTLSTLAGKAFLGGNLGLGVDLGFTWYKNDRWKFTGSIIDLGFINHKKDVENYRYHGNYQTDGIEILFPGPGEGTPNYWDEWEDDLDEHLEDETLYSSYNSWRPVKFNGSVDFGFLEDTEPCNCHEPTDRRRYKHHLGLHWFAVSRPRGLVSAATVYFDKRFSNNFRAKIAYTADAYSFSNIGLMFSTRFHNFNFYLAADNLLDYTNLAKAHNASVQMGFQLIMNSQ